jgi:carboxyl-terminal processing protease
MVPTPRNARPGQSRTAAVAAIFLLLLVTGGWLIERGAGTTPQSLQDGVRLFESVRQRVLADYVDSLSEQDLYRRAVAGVLRELKDPYTTLLTPTRASQLSEATTGNYAGLGIRIDVRGEGVIVVSTLPGSPGEEAGIVTGDRIIEIEGVSTEGWTSEDAMKALRGPEGSKIQFKVLRDDSAEPLTFKLVRRAIHQSAVRRASMLKDRVGYIELRTFSDSTEKELARGIDSLLARDMQTLILDLRGNPGGLLKQGVHVSDLFLGKGQRIVSTRGRTPVTNSDYVDAAPERWPQLKLVVLVDEMTASASEIVAGALQDHDRAVVIGVPTYGKGSAQMVYPLGEVGAVKLTTARWFTPSGRSITRKAATVDEDDLATEKQEKFRTDAGRTVLGGGGITPDLFAGDTVTPPENLAFHAALIGHVKEFRATLIDYALEVKSKRAVTSPDFAVTPEMRNDIWERLSRRGIPIPRPVFDAAARFVDRIVGYEIARYVFGLEAEFQRKAAADRAIIAALSLARNATSESAMLKRAAELQEASKGE